MRKLLVFAIAALALAAPAAAGKAPLVIGMHDPGCHWFVVGGKYVKSVTRTGPVTLLDADEAALVIKGPGGTRQITMVKQAPDDNHLKLTIR
jgi:hypothetical protein